MECFVELVCPFAQHDNVICTFFRCFGLAQTEEKIVYNEGLAAAAHISIYCTTKMLAITLSLPASLAFCSVV